MIIFQGMLLSPGAIPVLGNLGTMVGVALGAGVVGTGVGVEVGVIEGVGVGVGVGVGATEGVGVGVALGVGIGVGVGVGVGVATAHDGTVIVSVSVVTVPPKARALPVNNAVLPIVIPEGSIMVPLIVELAPRVVAEVGVQKTSQDDDPPDNVTTELATVVSAPLILNIYVPAPPREIPAVPIDAAPDVQ